MNLANTPLTSLWYDEAQGTVFYIDQTKLPWELKISSMRDLDDAVRAINNMEVRGAPLLGVAAAFGMWMAGRDGMGLQEAARRLKATRPTAVNLGWAVDRMLELAEGVQNGHRELLEAANDIRTADIECCRDIGRIGLPLIEGASSKKRGEPVNILTHCNAGWLACIDWGTALAPVYLAHDSGIKVHVWVDETRPRNQGARLTAWELGAHGVPFTLIPDNTGGHLMQNGMVDMVIVGTDRTAANGDVANKIGTYLKALAASDNNIPFYVAMPWSTYDPQTPDGKHIAIEERNADEVRIMSGFQTSVNIVPPGTPAANYGFDITPARLITAYITETGITRDPASFLQ